MSSWIRALLVAVAAAVVAVISVPTIGAIAVHSAQLMPVSTYNAPVYPQPATDAATERGPPAAYDRDTTYDAVGLPSDVASARSDGLAARAITAYPTSTTLAQAADRTTTTGRQVVIDDGVPSSFRHWQVAANSGYDALRAARAARDAKAAEVGRSKATVTGGYGRDGVPVAGCNRNPIGCAEDDVARQIGGDPSDINFTEAIRPRTGEQVPICARCQGTYEQSQFPPGTLFDPDGPWGRR